jgi:hypothetical protein
VNKSSEIGRSTLVNAAGSGGANRSGADRVTDGKKWLRNLTTIPARADERLKRTQPIKADGNGASDFIKEEAHELGEEAPKS